MNDDTTQVEPGNGLEGHKSDGMCAVKITKLGSVLCRSGRRVTQLKAASTLVSSVTPIERVQGELQSMAGAVVSYNARSRAKDGLPTQMTG